MQMQDVKFNNVEEFFEYITDEEFAITNLLRKTINGCIPEINEKLSFNVLYFFRNYSLCFIWPASVKWGKKETFKGVRLGFAKGYMLTDEHNFLKKDNRKQVYWRDFANIKEIDIEIIKSLLYEAILIDDQLFRNKKTVNSKKLK